MDVLLFDQPHSSSAERILRLCIISATANPALIPVAKSARVLADLVDNTPAYADQMIVKHGGRILRTLIKCGRAELVQRSVKAAIKNARKRLECAQ